MNPKTLDKIRALANDTRGDPATRSRAQEKLRELGQEEPPPQPKLKRAPANRLHPGMRTDPLYELRTFNDLTQWGTTKSGNFIHHVYRYGITYRIVLFRHKKTDTFGWMREDDLNGQTEFSDRFRTLGEAHADAWRNLPIT